MAVNADFSHSLVLKLSYCLIVGERNRAILKFVKGGHDGSNTVLVDFHYAQSVLLTHHSVGDTTIQHSSAPVVDP